MCFLFEEVGFFELLLPLIYFSTHYSGGYGTTTEIGKITPLSNGSTFYVGINFHFEVRVYCGFELCVYV